MSIEALGDVGVQYTMKMRLTSPSSLATVGALLLCSGIGWLTVLHYEIAGPAPSELITISWSPPWTLRAMVLVGFMLLIWAGGATFYKLLRKLLRH